MTLLLNLTPIKKIEKKLHAMIFDLILIYNTFYKLDIYAIEIIYINHVLENDMASS